MEGKEARFGIVNSALWATAHDRRVERLGQRDARLVHAARRPGADVADPARRGDLRRRRLRASTACSIFAIVAVFVAGLMIGRTPEYLGKKIEAFEMKMAAIAVLIPSGHGARRHRGRRRPAMPARPASRIPGAHGFSEILYAFSSAGNNNGSAFAGSVRQHALLQHSAWALPCCSRATGWPSRCWRLPALW